MTTNQKVSGNATALTTGIAWGVVVSVSSIIAQSALIAWLINTGKMKFQNIGYGIMILLLLSAFLGAMSSCKKVKRKRLLVSIVTGICLFVILLCTTGLFFGGKYQAVGESGLMILCGSMLAAMWTSRGGTRKRRPNWR